MRGRALYGVVDRRSGLGVLAAVNGAVGGARVDTCEVDVGVDCAEDEAEEAKHDDGYHST